MRSMFWKRRSSSPLRKSDLLYIKPIFFFYIKLKSITLQDIVMTTDYEKMLDSAMEKIPKVSDSSERFKIPEIKAFLVGTKTIINNFTEIANAVRRKPEHMQKFLLKELATKGNIEGPKLFVQGKFTRQMINKKLDLYYKTYVYCPECGKPDTKIVKEDRFFFLRCEACGSKNIVKKI